jgi:hypothetical protein
MASGRSLIVCILIGIAHATSFFCCFVSAALPAAAIIVKNQKRAEERETKGADIL